MEAKAFGDFFVASSGASAALIWLLFVAIAVEPGRIVGEDAPAEPRAVASGAFTAFANVFFVSLAGTWPASTGALGFVGMAAGDVGEQAFALGLVDEVAMDVDPVVFGSGKRYFGSVDGQHLLEDPDVVIRDDRVLHLCYRVRR